MKLSAVNNYFFYFYAIQAVSLTTKVTGSKTFDAIFFPLHSRSKDSIAFSAISLIG